MLRLLHFARNDIVCLSVMSLLAFITAGHVYRAEAVTPIIWKDNTQGTFQKGKPENVTITSDGKLKIAPDFDEVADMGQEHVWCLAYGKDGMLYVGTGNEGKVFKVSPGGEAVLVFDSPEVGIHSLAVDSEGNVYAGSSPDGIVYRIGPDGEASTFCSTGETYIWALVLGSKGELFAGTGGGGKVIRISKDGKVEDVYDPPDGHVMCLISDGNGWLYAGTEGDGVVYRISEDGDVRVLFDADEKEIHSLALGDGGILYAGAIPGKGNPGEAHPTVPLQAPQASARRSGMEGCSLYKIYPSGASARLWKSGQPLLLSMLRDEHEGGILVSTGDEGYIYRVMPDGRWSTVTRLKDAKPSVLFRGTEGEVFVGTSGSGSVYKLSSGYSKEGTFESDVHDFTINSSWGRMTWRGVFPKGTEAQFQTRSGNVKEVDDTWSDWSNIKKNGDQISSPPGRFLQYRATLTTSDKSKTPLLGEVSLAGLQENLVPQLETVQLYPYRRKEGGRPGNGKMGQSQPGGPEALRQGPPGSPKPQTMKNSLWMIKWQAHDPNDDALVYDLFFKGAEEKDWKVLKEDLKPPFYIWDTESVPDGTTLIKVLASDRPSNPEDMALLSEGISDPFEIDNTPPSVDKLKAQNFGNGTISVKGQVVDATSPVVRGEYSIDSVQWVVFFPQDRIFDSKVERFSFTIDGLSEGEHTIVVRVSDSLGNMGAGRAIVNIK